MQIGEKGVENPLVHMVLEKKIKRHKKEKKPFHASLFKNGRK
jgi:hypothetical protein